MRLCDETVTVYNARLDPARRMDVYVPTVLKGVSWHGEPAATMAEHGLKAAGGCVLRVPEAVDAGGKAYAEPADYRAAGDISGLWTLQRGDVIVRGACAEAVDPAGLRERFGTDRVATVVGVTDNRRAPRGRHWRVVGKF